MKNSGFNPLIIEYYKRRFKFAVIIVAVIFTLLFLRLWYLQILKGQLYRLRSEKNRIRLNETPSIRGKIFDRNGLLLVDNSPSYDLYVVPEEIRYPKETFNVLNRFVKFDLKESLNRYKNNNRLPFIPFLIKKNISRVELVLVENHRFSLAGVMIKVRPVRRYRYGSLASHLLGYLGKVTKSELNAEGLNLSPDDMVGRAGIEARYNKLLMGVKGGEQIEVDAMGRRIKVLNRVPPTSGYDLVLTIDTRLQRIVEDCLLGKKGAIVAMNPRDGEILAMASSPNYDPNIFIQGMDINEWKSLVSKKGAFLQNRAISGQYPPGSVFKIVTAISALEEGMIDTDDEIFCSGKYRVGDTVFRCWKRYGHGPISFYRAMAESCDIYFYKLGQRLGIEKIAKWAKELGLGRKTGIPLPGEKPGLVPTSKWKLKTYGIPWQIGDTLAVSIGQGYLLVSPIQMAVMISSIFNGGYIYQPRLIKEIRPYDKRFEKIFEQKRRKIKVKAKTLCVVKRSMIHVVEDKNGTGRRARVKGIRVAGKTGTAQLISTKERRSKDKDISNEIRDHAWFVAVAPADNPKIALSIIIEHGGHGGSTAAPIAAKIISEYLRWEKRDV
ncbi:MAG TPA: penicillin-binding protein 2 [Desulfobacteraceae bacterium]|nr:penicillin-binding protein 2 [Desulfobacteraceae bacterium]